MAEPVPLSPPTAPGAFIGRDSVQKALTPYTGLPVSTLLKYAGAMQLAFLQPHMAWLLLAVPLVWFLPARARRKAQAALRSLVLSLVIVALAQPVLLTPRAGGHRAVVLDRTASVDDGARAAALSAAAELAEAGAPDVTVLQLGGEVPALEENGVWLRAGADNATPLGATLDLAAQSISAGTPGAVVLLTDGRATERQWGKPLGQLLERGLPVHVVPLASKQGLFLADLRTPTVRPGETARVAVDVVGAGAGVEVLLRLEDAVVARSGRFDADGRRTVVLELEGGAPGFHPFTVELAAPQAADTASRRAGVLVVRDPVRVLYLGERQQGAPARLRTLVGEGFAFADVQPGAEGFDFRHHDLAMLDDMPARALPQSAQRALADAVANEGLGLLHSGGGAAFADGGYYGQPLADVLPVELRGEEDKVDPSVGLAIIIDTSGSMGGTRIELAKQIARIAVRRLQPHDRIGIVEFYGAKHWAVPMQPAANKIEIDRAIGRMKAIGGTVLYPAMQEAYYGLKNVNTRFKHILLITDAGVEDSNYERMTRRIAKDGINVSTILVGQGGHNLIMSDIANWGRGRFYAVGDQFSLVELVLKQPSTRKPPRYKRGAFRVRGLGGAGWWGPVPRAAPPLAGYAEVEARDGAEVLLETDAQDGARHPLLASWRHGLGRVTALMTEPVGEGTAPWRDWPDYGEFLSRVLARTAADHAPFHLALTRRGDALTLRAERDEPDNALVPEAHLVDADGERLAARPVVFREQAPGLFEATIDAPRGETVRVVVEAAGRRQRVAAAANSDIAPETQVDPRSALPLERLAQRTGGTVLSVAVPPEAFAVGSATSEAATSLAIARLWPFLLLAGLLAYLGELLYRRWPRD